jgi:protein-ribulosamine 3-kinase
VGETPLTVEDALGASLGLPVRVKSRTPLSGGDISRVERLETSAGRFVLKSHPHPPDGLFVAEAAGLSALAAAHSSLRIPSVIATNAAFLVLEDLGEGTRPSNFDEVFGRGLAQIHKHGAPRFGFSCGTFCGTTRQPNRQMNSWIDFYTQARLGHQLMLARSARLLSNEDAHLVEQLLEKLDTLLTEPPEGARLIHGDLWSGNLHVASDGTPALIDPSAYFAHREAELGMITLFGSWPSRAHAAYEEVFPLESGWRDRNPLYQLYHLMNHLNLFGGGYHAGVMDVVRRYL